jgi:hypothetical protein
MAISAPTSFATSWALPIRAPGQRSGVASSAIAGSADMMQFACSARGNAVEPSARRRMKIGGASSARRGAGQPAAPSVALHSKRRAAAGDFAAPAVASARVAGAGGCEIEPKSLPHGGGPLGDRRPRRGAHRHPKSEPAKRAFGDAFVNPALNFLPASSPGVAIQSQSYENRSINQSKRLHDSAGSPDCFSTGKDLFAESHDSAIDSV